MMIMPGPFEILIVLFFGGLFLMLMFRVFGGSGRSGGGGFSFGHTTLTCPHCGKETRADNTVCEQCGRDL